MQAVRKHEQPGADTFDGLAARHIELNDGRLIGAVRLARAYRSLASRHP